MGPGGRQVFLFTGHMIDRVDRAQARFPPGSEGAVAIKIFEVLDSLGAGPGDLGICGGAAGGDILFAEACLGRGMEVVLYLPQAEEDFLAVSVDPSGTGWRQRFRALVDSTSTRIELLDETYRADEGLGLYSRLCWALLDLARVEGEDPPHLIAVWDGLPGDGSGGTADMVEMTRRHTDSVHLIRPSG